MTKIQELRPTPLANSEDDDQLAICRERMTQGSENSVEFAEGMARVFGRVHQDAQLSFKERSTYARKDSH